MVETARLPEAKRDELERLVEASGFFGLPARGGGGGPGGAHSRPMPDARQLDIEVEDDQGRRHRVTMPEHATSPQLMDLVERAWDAAADE